MGGSKQEPEYTQRVSTKNHYVNSAPLINKFNDIIDECDAKDGNARHYHGHLPIAQTKVA